MINSPFQVRVAGRRMQVTVDWPAIDCRDILTGDESQAIGGVGMTTRETVLADSQVRDAIRSAYYNATSRESGRYPVGGTRLPDGFAIEII
jgi:hypothetical protein